MDLILEDVRTGLILQRDYATALEVCCVSGSASTRLPPPCVACDAFVTAIMELLARGTAGPVKAASPRPATSVTSLLREFTGVLCVSCAWSR